MNNPMTGEPISDASIASLAAMALELQRLNESIESLEKTLELQKEESKKLSTTLIPDKMAELGMEEFKLSNGRKVVVKPFYSGKFIDGKNEQCVEWLETNGHGGVVKREISCPFQKGDGRIKEVTSLLFNMGIPFEKIENVHPMTFKALLRELTESGKTMPPDLFITFVGKTTKIT